MPNFKFDFFVVIEELTDTFNLEHQTQVVLILVLLPFPTVAKASNLYVIEVADTLTRKIWHEVIKLVERHGSRELLAGIVNLCRTIKVLLPVVLLYVANKDILSEVYKQLTNNTFCAVFNLNVR